MYIVEFLYILALCLSLPFLPIIWRVQSFRLLVSYCERFLPTFVSFHWCWLIFFSGNFRSSISDFQIFLGFRERNISYLIDFNYKNCRCLKKSIAFIVNMPMVSWHMLKMWFIRWSSIVVLSNTHINLFDKKMMKNILKEKNLSKTLIFVWILLLKMK